MNVSPQTLERRAEERRKVAQKTLKALRGYWDEYKCMPSLTELGDRLGVYAKSWTHECVNRLIESGHVRRMPNGRLAPGEHFFDSPPQ